MLDNSIGINAPARIWHLEQPQRNANSACLCATRLLVAVHFSLDRRGRIG